jgi:hypothetical protein
VVGFAFCAGAVEGTSASPIPLEKGTRWVYEAKAKWTPVAGSGRTGVQSARIKWTAEVLDCVQGKTVRAAVVHAFPMEILGMDPEKPDGYTVLVETSNRLYSASADSVRKARKLAREFAAAPEKLTGHADLLLEWPLQADRPWGSIAAIEREDDGWYCWHVEAEKAQRLKVKGLSTADPFTIWTVAFRTCPDHQVIDIAPGVGITHLEYEHHGTVASENVCLVQFKAGP